MASLLLLLLLVRRLLQAPQIHQVGEVVLGLLSSRRGGLILWGDHGGQGRRRWRGGGAVRHQVDRVDLWRRRVATVAADSAAKHPLMALPLSLLLRRLDGGGRGRGQHQICRDLGLENAIFAFVVAAKWAKIRLEKVHFYLS